MAQAFLATLPPSLLSQHTLHLSSACKPDYLLLTPTRVYIIHRLGTNEVILKTAAVSAFVQ